MARPPKKKVNPILTATQSWLDSLPQTLIETLTTQLGIDDTNDTKQQLLARAPKRWVVYEPMVLLPSGSFTTSPWPAFLTLLTPPQKETLWSAILSALSPPSKPPLTHLAINEGIPLHNSSSSSSSPSSAPETTAAATAAATAPETENILRSPSGLRPLFGSFGPSTTSSPPTTADFDSTLWVTTTQNTIHQTWAPLHTMFSRGNVKEKARLLTFPSYPTNATNTPSSAEQATKTRQKFAIDLYAGIGYFALGYARLGLRVLCWELNPWSVEGLVRGARRNGWSVRVVVGAAAPASDKEKEVEVDMDAVLAGGEQIVVFLEDNRLAARRVAEVSGKMEVVHVNCGFLPSSEGVWRDAVGMQVGSSDGTGGWLHLHENVGVDEVEGRRAEVQRLMDRWAGEAGREARVEHVELVKTFAPGVWHCVFDVFITGSSETR